MTGESRRRRRESSHEPASSSRHEVTNIKFRIGLNNCFVVDGHGKGGGLALYWDDATKIDILSYGVHHIDTLVWDGSHHAAWRGTFIYGEPKAQDSHLTWELIHRIEPRSQALAHDR
jgi:hypothetical protein